MSEMVTDEVPMVLEVNCATGEQTMRPMTVAELEQREVDRLAAEAAEAERVAAAEAAAAALASARQELLDMGLSEGAVDAIMASRQ
jgi:hypothetical protein